MTARINISHRVVVAIDILVKASWISAEPSKAVLLRKPPNTRIHVPSPQVIEPYTFARRDVVAGCDFSLSWPQLAAVLAVDTSSEPVVNPRRAVSRPHAPAPAHVAVAARPFAFFLAARSRRARSACWLLGEAGPAAAAARPPDQRRRVTGLGVVTHRRSSCRSSRVCTSLAMRLASWWWK